MFTRTHFSRRRHGQEPRIPIALDGRSPMSTYRQGTQASAGQDGLRTAKTPPKNE